MPRVAECRIPRHAGQEGDHPFGLTSDLALSRLLHHQATRRSAGDAVVAAAVIIRLAKQEHLRLPAGNGMKPSAAASGSVPSRGFSPGR
jgi:hypothetical protein